ncbi:hypothetical protein, partial [Streptomyces clavuligerus]
LVMVVLSLSPDTDTVGADAPVRLILLLCVPSLAAGVWLYAAAERRARQPRRVPSAGVGYGVALGLLYGVSSLAVKGMSGRLTGLSDRPAAVLLDVLGSPYPYLLLVTGALGLVMSQAALQRCRVSLVVPVCTTVTSVFTAVLGTFAFGEALPDDPVRLSLRVAGALLAVAVLLTMAQHAPEQHDPPRHDPPKSPVPVDLPRGADRP